MALPPFPTMGNWFAGNDTPYNKSNTLLGVGLGLLSGKTAQDQVGQAASNFANERQMGRTYNKTIKYLQSANPELAQAVESGALSPIDAYKLHLSSQAKADRPLSFQTLPDGTYGFADPDTGTFKSLGNAAKPAGVGGGEYGLNPIYGTDAEGNTGIGQVGKDGSFHVVDTKGFKPVGTTHNLNLGTTYQTQDRAGNVIGNAPIDISGKNTQEAIGEAQGKAIAAAPGDLQAAQNALDMVESIRNDPYKATGTGFSSLGNAIPGTGGYDFSNKVDQAKSGAFLTAIQQMRGLGSLSNAEGGAATAAVNRMNTATSEPEFNAALDDYEKIVRQGAARAQQRLQQGGGQVQAPPGLAPTAPGATSSGVKWSVEP